MAAMGPIWLAGRHWTPARRVGGAQGSQRVALTWVGGESPPTRWGWQLRAPESMLTPCPALPGRVAESRHDLLGLVARDAGLPGRVRT